MNRQNLSKIVLIIACGIILAGCGYINKKLEQNPTTQRQQQCSALKQQITFSQSAIDIRDQASKNVTQDAQAARLYKKYNCAEFEQQ